MAEHKFVALLPVRDEADIIAQCITALLDWADLIFVFDTGSVDGTFEILQDLAVSEKRIRIVASEPVYYNENRVRGYLFERARDHLSEGDFFLRVDADEFHHVSPRHFVKQHFGRIEGVAYHQYFDFALTDDELNAWQAGRETLADRLRPIEERRRHYTISVYSEPRLCRYRPTMKWPGVTSFPYNAGFVSRARLPIRHYPHRDPEQLKLRVRLRKAMMSDRTNRTIYGNIEHHWDEEDWRRFVRSADDPLLHHWAQRTPLPMVGATSHLPGPFRRSAQRLFYSLALPRVADVFRPGWTDESKPLAVPSDVQADLAKEFASNSSRSEAARHGDKR